jgi:DNA-binding protein
MSEEQTALNDVLKKKDEKKEPVEETQETAEEVQEPAPAEQKPEEEQKPAEEKPEEPAEEKKEEPEPEPKEEVKQEEPAPEKKEEPEPAPEQKEEAQQEEPAEPEPEKATEVVQKDEPKKQETQKPRMQLAENVVLVGKKPTMSYVLAAVTQFSDGLNKIHIKARGRSISRAVDVAEVVRNRFVQDAKTDVQIGTQEITDDNNNKINVSTINITLSK